MKRYGLVLGLKPEMREEYIRLHAAVWPEVLKTIADCNIRNYSIFFNEGEDRLFAYYEYHGTDYAADMARMAADPMTQKWWDVCIPCQQPLDSRKPGEWWAEMPEVFHTD